MKASVATVMGLQPDEMTAVIKSSVAAVLSSSESITIPGVMDSIKSDVLNTDYVSLLQSINDIFLTPLVTTPWHSAAVLVLSVGALTLRWLDGDDLASMETPFAPGTDTYSWRKSEEFYGQRPLLVARRVLKLALVSGAFNTGVVWDWLVLGRMLGDEEYTALHRAEPRRAKESLALCEKMGPTFIKLGQALSIRTDLIPEAYALELRQLQDAVSPFDNEEAYDILREELGDLNKVFSSLSPRPIASASIGQVYRGTLREDNTDVAVKVQRPGILAEIALDLYVLRLLTPLQTTLQNTVNGVSTSPEDVETALALVDEWGRGFVAETDYRLEAENTRTFGEAMQARGLDAVCAPRVVDVRDRVLLTEWVTGTRLDREASPDVPRLCGVAINAYLTMLLDTGVLHCDPHPGNLLRTTEGRLCILDWGMTLRVPSDLQYALLEFIAHINTEDYDAVAGDFINLGFSPEGVTADRLKSSGITEGLSFALRQLSAGGGPKKIQERVKDEFRSRYGADLSDEELRVQAKAEMMQAMEDQLAQEGVDVKGVTNVMEEMSRRNRELFTLPPYVLYVARAFSTLEGIGLSIDENYAIVQECYPYLARRLFTDRNPRAKKALQAMLGLDGNSNTNSALSTDKLYEMSQGFTSYTAATTDVARDEGAAWAELSRLVLDPRGSTLQDLLVDETTKVGDALARSAFRSALDNVPALPVQAQPLLPSWWPKFVEELVGEEDERVLETVRLVADNVWNSTTAGLTFPNNDDLRNVLANGMGDGALGVPPPPLVGDEVSNNNVDEQALPQLLLRTVLSSSDQWPGVANFGRRIGAGLFRRAAWRTERTTVLPDATRRILVQANTRLANVIMEEEEEEEVSS